MRYLQFFIAFLGLLQSISAAPGLDRLESNDTLVLESCREIFNTSCEGLLDSPSEVEPVPPVKRELPENKSESDCECVIYYQCSTIKDTKTSNSGTGSDSSTKACPGALEICCPKSSMVPLTSIADPK